MRQVTGSHTPHLRVTLLYNNEMVHTDTLDIEFVKVVRGGRSL